jgi:adenylate cyclase
MTAIGGDRRLPEQPGNEALTSAEVAASAGVTLEEARRLWRALGFPDAGGDAAFTEADRQALELVATIVDEGGIDLETVVRLTRALGRTMSRLAEWQVSALAGRTDLSHIGESVAPAFEQLLVYAWRRHLGAAAGRMQGMGAGSEEDVLVATQSVGFADLVGFTALSNGMDEDELAMLVEGFESGCADLVAGRGGRVVKTLGDSVLFAADDPVVATEIALAVVETIGAEPDLPDVRVGIATGAVVMRMGDVYGSPVNLASRLTTVARRNRVICDAETARALPRDDFDTRVLPARPMRGFGDVEPIAVRRRWVAG